jgi:NADH-quinone oxidoreductase subunit A
VTGVSIESVLFVAAAAAAAAGFAGVVLGANKLLSPRAPTAEKLSPYECGMEPAGDPHAPVRLRYAALAVIFVIFDAESVLLFAVAGRLKGSPMALVAVGVFALFLAGGLVYAWRKGALAWR